ALGVSPKLRNARVGLPQQKQLQFGDLFPDPRALPPSRWADDSHLPYTPEGVTGKGGPGKYQEGALKITGKDPAGNELYEHPQYKAAARSPLFTSPLIDDAARNPSVIPNAPPIQRVGEGVYSSQIPDVMRMTNRNSGSSNAWMKEFKKRGINEEELKMFGVLPLLESGQDVSREDVVGAYNDTIEAGKTGAIWRAGEGVAPYSQEPPEGGWPDSPEQAEVTRITGDIDTGRNSMMSQLTGPANSWMDQVLGNIESDGSFLDIND
ncbi:unnamed protein product, partial [marine sediment metagenome]